MSESSLEPDSIVKILLLSGIVDNKEFNVVVLPELVAPAITKETPYRRHIQRKSIIFCVAPFSFTISSFVTLAGCNRRIDTLMPLSSSTMGVFKAAILVLFGK